MTPGAQGSKGNLGNYPVVCETLSFSTFRGSCKKKAEAVARHLSITSPWTPPPALAQALPIHGQTTAVVSLGPCPSSLLTCIHQTH